jgi:hypothetical protein
LNLEGGKRMRKVIMGLLALCMVNIISVKGDSLKFAVNENQVQNAKAEAIMPLADDDRSKNIRSENKRLRKEKAKYRKIYRDNKKQARKQNRQLGAGERIYSGHRDMVETRSVGGM